MERLQLACKHGLAGQNKLGGPTLILTLLISMFGGSAEQDFMRSYLWGHSEACFETFQKDSDSELGNWNFESCFFLSPQGTIRPGRLIVKSIVLCVHDSSVSSSPLFQLDRQTALWCE